MSHLRRTLIASALLVLSGCVSLPRETPPELSCDGPITEATTRADLVTVFGIENVRDEEIELGEGETTDGTVIYPDDPARRIEIAWNDPERKSRVASVRIAEPSEWSIAGLSPGLDLQAVERLNGRPFSLYGFDWDYSGTIASWNGGTLDMAGGCRVLARFRPSGETDTERSLSGEEVFGSEDPLMRELNPTIYELLLIFE